MNYAEIKKHDIANGIGVRVSLFVSGCNQRCEGCFNSATWDFNYGNEFTQAVENELILALSRPFIRGLTLIGGEPLEPENQPRIAMLLKRVRHELPHKDIWCYSGFTFEQLTGAQKSRATTEHIHDILSMIDVLVDGKFELEIRNLSLPFRGSENQRILDVRQSLEKGLAVEWQQGK